MEQFIKDTEPETTPPTARSQVQDKVIKIAVIIIMIAFGAVFIWFVVKPQYLSDTLLWVKEQGTVCCDVKYYIIIIDCIIATYHVQGYWGNLIIGLSFVLIAFPFAFTGYTILALASGFLYGFVVGKEAINVLYQPCEGEITCFIGANILGTAASFWVCSTLAKAWVERQISSRRQLSAFLKIVQQHGFKIALLFRFTPIPYGIQNGVFSVRYFTNYSYI